jgi:hypothetical protein
MKPIEAYRKSQLLSVRDPLLESVIAESSGCYCLYALRVVNGRFIKGEPAIQKSVLSSFMYAKRIMKGRWFEAEHTMSKARGYAIRYAEEVIKGDFLNKPFRS